MNLTRTLLMTLALASTPLAPPALADIGPPRKGSYRASPPAVPDQLVTWFAKSLAAMREGSVEVAKTLCDERGFEQNLVGSSGTTLASLFAQGHRKKWHLQIAPDKVVRSHRGSYITTAHVVDNTDAKRLDTLHIFFVPDADGSFRALGASESQEDIHALASRWRKNQDLAPPPSKGD